MTGHSIEPLAEDALLLRFGIGIDVQVNARVHAAARALREARLQGITEIAPAYASLLIRFDPFACNGDMLREAITQALGPGLRRGDEQKRSDARASDPGFCPSDEQKAAALENPSAPYVEIPVCYGGELGPDLATVAAHAKLSPNEVATRHTAGSYTVAMLGFAPGFPYLLGLDPALHMPRRADPRTHVPAGSVAIGGAQTGIYPRELPGGWQLIGRTPLRLFDPARESPCLLEPGQRVRFRAIDADTFTQLARHGA